MKSFAILGSGFGLYGYLPALIQAGVQQVLLPERYRARFFERPELISFEKNLQWEKDESTALEHAEGVVLALRPIDQEKWIPYCLSRSNIKRMILEKPLAHSPEVASRLLDNLIQSNKDFRFGHVFRYTVWGQQLMGNLTTNHTGADFLSMHWSFLAHHFRYDLNNWKRFISSGGGVIRFYGIQVIALLAELGYRNVISSQASGVSADEIERWTATFDGAGLPRCKILVNTKSEMNRFQIEQATKTGTGSRPILVINQGDPFDEASIANEFNNMDRRVSLLSQLYRSLDEKNASYYEGYRAAIKLWMSIEEKTNLEPVSIST